MANRYTRALRQIKDKTIDEKLELLSEVPTNSTAGLYVDTPGYADPEIEVPGDIDSPLDLEEDGQGQEGYTGHDTTGLFMADGTIKAVEPPGDTSYVLGPMISMWYSWANYTQIGYVRESDRKMVNLGRIIGEMQYWDETNGFTSYGQLTLEQAVWYKNQTRKDYRAFYPGPPSNPADEYGRYLGSMVSTSKSTTKTVPENPYKRYTPGTNRASDPSDNFSLAMNDDLYNWMWKVYGLPAAEWKKKNPTKPDSSNPHLPGGSYVPRADAPGPGVRYPKFSDAPGSTRTRGQGASPVPNYKWDPHMKMMVPNLPRAKKKSKTMVAHHEPTGEFLTENRKRILRDIKKPVEVKEIPTKFKVKPTGRKNKIVGEDMMKVPETQHSFKPEPRIWDKGDHQKNIRASQEKKNEVLELVGAAEHHWTYLTEDSRKKKQEKVNEMMSAEFDKQMELLYEKHKIKENKTNKVRGLLSDSNLVYDKLDPQSAESMPPTGNPTVDANVKKATNTKEKSRKLKILLGKKSK